MKSLMFAATLVAATAWGLSTVSAQSPVTSTPQLGATAEIGAGGNSGTISGTERFLRSNRRQSAFVGSDLREGRGFIGRGEARTTAPIRSAVTTTPVPPRPDVNRQLQRAAVGRARELYRPRLELDFSGDDDSEIATRWEVADDLNRVMARTIGQSVQVHLEGETAVLQGTVGSNQSRALAERLVRIAPRVWDVRNELEVAAAAPAAVAPLAPSVEPVPTPTAGN
ncbi:MAG: BON domain-containing protein [Planctomycetales bacterium]|nr:BON domain-containing protein [Planctomycetales bacterium]